MNETQHASEEETLGGRITETVHIGDTVRRGTGPWTPAVHALLEHLEHVGFTAAPRALGIDEQSREILSYLPGKVAGTPPWPEWVWRDDTVRQAGTLLRKYHAAVSTFTPPANAVWRSGKASVDENTIVCHNDLSPLNVVFSKAEGTITGIIDWDFASPATPEWDLAHAAWQFVPLHHPELAEHFGWHHPDQCAPRLRLLCDAYGLVPQNRTGFVDLVQSRVCATRDGIVALAEHNSAFQQLVDDGHVAAMDRTIESISQRTRELSQALVE